MYKNSSNITLQLVLLLLLNMLFSCLSDDAEAPKIEADSFQLLAFNPVTEAFDIEINEDVPLVIPGSFVIKGTFSDNVQLNSMSATVEPVNINNNSSDTLFSIFPWETEEGGLELPLKGTSTEVFREVELPASAQSGLYNFSLVLYDELENISQELNESFRIENNSPLIKLTEPNEDYIEMLTGSTLAVKSNITSESYLDSIVVRLGVGDYFASATYILSDTTLNEFTIDTSFVLTDSIGVGRRYLRIYAIDEESNTGNLEVTVQIE